MQTGSKRIPVAAAILIAGLLTATIVHASTPTLKLILPRGGQIGSDTELTFHGDRLGDVEEVLF